MDTAGDHPDSEVESSEHDAHWPDDDNTHHRSNGVNGVQSEPVTNGGHSKPLDEPVHAPELHDEPDEVEEDDNDESESESEDEEGDGDEDEEPALKYDLLGGSTTLLLQKDSASALAVCSKFVVRKRSNCFLYVGLIHSGSCRPWVRTQASFTP